MDDNTGARNRPERLHFPQDTLISIMNERLLAEAILDSAFRDAKQKVTAKMRKQRAGKERKIELIAEGQWFLLDDDDENAPCGFHWCCWAMQIDPGRLRRKTEAILRKLDLLLPKLERCALAEMAGKRRFRKHFRNGKALDRAG